jgi:hypothetical protein
MANKRPVRHFLRNKKDGFSKTPNSLLRCVPGCFSVRQIFIIAQDLRASPIL